MTDTNEHARTYGWLLLAFALLSVLGAAHHPTAGGDDLQGHLRSLSGGGMIRGVHGFIIAVMTAGFVGLCGVSRLLGLQRPWVLGGLVAMALGMATMTAGAINGFAVPHFAAGYDALRPDQAEPVRAMLRMSWAYNQALAGIGACLWGVAIVLWSIELVGRGGAARWVGAAGLLAGGAILIGLLAGLITLNLHGFLLITALLAAWSAAVGVLLLNGRLSAL
jgi:hypothetical protein